MDSKASAAEAILKGRREDHLKFIRWPSQRNITLLLWTRNIKHHLPLSLELLCCADLSLQVCHTIRYMHKHTHTAIPDKKFSIRFRLPYTALAALKCLWSRYKLTIGAWIPIPNFIIKYEVLPIHQLTMMQIIISKTWRTVYKLVLSKVKAQIEGSGHLCSVYCLSLTLCDLGQSN